jgi:hypothetical protein
MKRKQLQDRLSNKLKRESLLLLAGSVGAFLVGLVVLFFTFWFTFGTLLLTTYWWISLSYNMLCMLSMVFLMLLFIGNATTDRKYLDKIELNIGPHRDLEVAVAIGTGFGSILAFSDGKAARSSIKMFTTLLYTGPRIIVASWYMMKHALKLKNINFNLVTPAIAKAYKAEARVSLEQLLEGTHEATHRIILEDLLKIDGVVLLRSPPAGITLSPEFIEALRHDPWCRVMKELTLSVSLRPPFLYSV